MSGDDSPCAPRDRLRCVRCWSGSQRGSSAHAGRSGRCGFWAPRSCSAWCGSATCTWTGTCRRCEHRPIFIPPARAARRDRSSRRGDVVGGPGRLFGQIRRFHLREVDHHHRGDHDDLRAPGRSEATGLRELTASFELPVDDPEPTTGRCGPALLGPPHPRGGLARLRRRHRPRWRLPGRTVVRTRPSRTATPASRRRSVSRGPSPTSTSRHGGRRRSPGPGGTQGDHVYPSSGGRTTGPVRP